MTTRFLELINYPEEKLCEIQFLSVTFDYSILIFLLIRHGEISLKGNGGHKKKLIQNELGNKNFVPWQGD